MPHFAYKAKHGPQQIITGSVEADSLSLAITKITQLGHIPLEVHQQEKAPVEVIKKGKHKQREEKLPKNALYQFTRQLADLLEAGIPLVRCMELLSKQRQYPALVKIVEALTLHLQQGGTLSSALAQYPAIFTPLYVNTVKAAEVSGQLPLVLSRLAQFLEQDLAIQSKVKSSLLYPTIILCVGILTIFIMLSFVLPRLTLMFEDFNSKLPLITQMVVALSELFAHYWWAFVCIGAAIFLWVRNFFSTPRGKMWRDQTSLRIPLLKSFIENTQLSRFARTLGMLLESGVPVVAALEAVTTVMDNSILQEEVRKIALKVKGGMSLTQAIKANSLFPEVAVDLIAVGQESGKLERGLYKLAAGCERASQDLAQTFLTILGPAVLVIVVGIVGVMIVAMLLPMFQMNMIIQ